MVIKNLRLKNGWSQEKLAELSNLSLRTIQRIEKDDSAPEFNPKVTNFLAFCILADTKSLEIAL